MSVRSEDPERRWGPTTHTLEWEIDASAVKAIEEGGYVFASNPAGPIPFTLGEIKGRLWLSVGPSMSADCERMTIRVEYKAQFDADLDLRVLLATLLGATG